MHGSRMIDMCSSRFNGLHRFAFGGRVCHMLTLGLLSLCRLLLALQGQKYLLDFRLAVIFNAAAGWDRVCVSPILHSPGLIRNIAWRRLFLFGTKSRRHAMKFRD